MKKQKYKIAGIRWISNSETGLREEYVDYLEVKGYPVTLPGYDGEGFDWFVYKTAMGKWAVTDVRTGTGCGTFTQGRTIKEAILNVTSYWSFEGMSPKDVTSWKDYQRLRKKPYTMRMR